MELQVNRVSKTFGNKVALSTVSFAAGPGVTCVVGPSGGGKTTLLRILLGLEAPDTGEVLGLETARLAAVFQEDRLLAGLTARGNLRFALGSAYDDTAAAQMLGKLGLGEPGEQPVREFSGGMKRRVALARALLAPGEVLVLDEPFAGLDEESRRRALSCVEEYGAGKIVVLVTHDLGDALALHAAVVVLPAGEEERQ